MKKIIPIFLCLFLFGPPDLYAKSFKSTAAQTSLVELYTSEGCSSCPPADKWLGGLKKNKGLWKRFIPLSFHVAIWDYIGWKDRMADADYSRRHNRYASEWRSRYVYTPGMVLNGSEWKGWRTGNLPGVTGKKPGVLEFKVTGSTFDITFDSSKTLQKPVVHAARVGMGIKSDVSRGENRGRKLMHDFTVLEYGIAQLTESDGKWHAKIDLDFSEAKAAWAKDLAVVVWVEEASLQKPLQAAGGYL